MRAQQKNGQCPLNWEHETIISAIVSHFGSLIRFAHYIICYGHMIKTQPCRQNLHMGQWLMANGQKRSKRGINATNKYIYLFVCYVEIYI